MVRLSSLAKIVFVGRLLLMSSAFKTFQIIPEPGSEVDLSGRNPLVMAGILIDIVGQRDYSALVFAQLGERVGISPNFAVPWRSPEPREMK